MKKIILILLVLFGSVTMLNAQTFFFNFLKHNIKVIGQDYTLTSMWLHDYTLIEDTIFSNGEKCYVYDHGDWEEGDSCEEPNTITLNVKDGKIIFVNEELFYKKSLLVNLINAFKEINIYEYKVYSSDNGDRLLYYFLKTKTIIDIKKFEDEFAEDFLDVSVMYFSRELDI